MRETRILQVQPSLPGESEDVADPLGPNKEAFLKLLGEAERFDPDFVSFPEVELVNGVERTERDVSEIALTFPGPFLDRVSDWAAQLESYVWVPAYEQVGSDIFNAVGLIDPEGDYLGSYRKVAPTIGELTNRGITPGGRLPVWDTDFGRVGATICWDVRFDEIALAYRAKGLDLMFHPTHGMGHGKFAHWATYHGFHIAYNFPSDARIFSPTGNIDGRMRSHPTMPSVDFEGELSARYGVSVINTDMESFNTGTFDYNDTELNEAQTAYPDTLLIHNPLKDGTIVLESRHPERSIHDIAEEFDLMTNQESDDYTRRLVADRIDDSPLFDPDELYGADATEPSLAPADD